MRLWRILAALMVVCQLLLIPAPGRAEPIPDKAHISGVLGYPQRFTLSCEARSAVDWAAYWGVNIREKKFLNNLPRSDNPDTGFVGDPSDEWGNLPPYSYGVHAEPVAEVLRQFGLQAEARRDLSWDDLRAEIAAGRPVIVWVIGQMWRGNPVRYKAQDGNTAQVARFEHTMILLGYTPKRVHVLDAFSGQTQTYPLNTFLASWDTLGRMAVTGEGPPVLSEIQEELVEPAEPAPVLPPEFNHHAYMPLVFGPIGPLQALSSAQEIPYTYTVRPGDYLADIARRYGLTWRQLADLNGIGYPYVIYARQVLRLR
jgi:uncharacterized protein YvpB